MGKFPKVCVSSIVLIQAVLFLICAITFADGSDLPSDPAEPDLMSSNYFVIYHRHSADLKKIEMDLKKRPLYFDQPARYGEVSTSQEICYRLDQLFNYARVALDMYPKTGKIRIVILKDSAELDAQYLKIFGKRGILESFYVYKYNTIYTSENDMTDSIIVHEMAHAIIDNYFSVVPPEAVREVLASYVDVHLEE